MSDPILAPTFLFHFAIPCQRVKTLWTDSGVRLGEEHRVPFFGELDQRQSFAELRLGWNPQGFVFRLTVRGKKQAPWCRANRMEDSDGLHLWLDTRATHNIHRAGRFCHWFVFAPLGAGRGDADPVAKWLPINRARELSKQSPPETLRTRSVVRGDGYLLEGAILASGLTGFEPREQPRIGFNYAIVDRELGTQAFTLGSEFPVDEDPSLWGDLELVDANSD